uniref:Uncharacterized protein n=1 Tax=Gadus morhua TaxID=8049 RepID=A0A8C5A544_GADMO
SGITCLALLCVLYDSMTKSKGQNRSNRKSLTTCYLLLLERHCVSVVFSPTHFRFALGARVIYPPV